ncbi:MAG TPA: DUF3037 domain-containing protein [Solirubrobacteraceae bacterium]|nr:DUF3037 domain-containing protein [Solirubrobacteraceae bacterium]
MSEAYQYALWRVVPDLERGERVNAGVVLYCPRLRFLGASVGIAESRLREFAPGLDVEAVSAALHHRALVAAGDPAAGSVAALPAGERFGLLVAPASTLVQPGPVHTGLSDDAAATLEQLFARLVLPPNGPATR